MLKDRPIELLGVTSVCLFVGTLVSEMLIFLPKMLAVYRKPIATPPKALIHLESSTTSKLTSHRIELSTIRALDRETQTELTTDWNKKNKCTQTEFV
ncbi:hypothetical protein DPMN_127786 [Dreissena polymorpha]|uniref:Uncharacterized protein n=1 Tax=Dreissena polymorpha TaxID=45954 RepID=A0A9D4GY87_DREPO|nr:hypothetical protein DPMN_127786 [Dreissena polymorpha]